MESSKKMQDVRRQDGNNNGMDGIPKKKTERLDSSKERRKQNPRTRKLVTEAKSARELLMILALLSITPLDILDTKMKGKFVIKQTNSNLEHFDRESTKKS